MSPDKTFSQTPDTSAAGDSAQKSPLKVDVWSDLVCPWCYIGKRRLEGALARLPDPDAVVVRWRSFELNPAAPRVATETTSVMLARKYGVSAEQAAAMQERVTSAAAGEGLRYRLDLTRAENSFDGHRLIHAAAAHGLQGAMKERLFAAYFTEGLSLGDHATLLRLAAEVGLDEQEARKVLESTAHAQGVRADEELATRLGISGVPFFVLGGRYGISGAQPVEVLLEALEKALQEHAEGATNPLDAL